MPTDSPALNMDSDELAFWKAVFLAVIGDRQESFSAAIIAADNAVGELRLRTDD
jgi:hypothetical protein